MTAGRDRSPAVCPYCGHVRKPEDSQPSRCSACHGVLDGPSQHATQNAMGPWYIRDDQFPFRPGCSYATLVRLVDRNKVGPQTILRGPTTNQFWELASRTPCVAHLLGICHQCGEPVQPTDKECHHCHAHFLNWSDRQSLGLMPISTVDELAATIDEADVVSRNSHLLQVGHEHMSDSAAGRSGLPGPGAFLGTGLMSAHEVEEDDDGPGWRQEETADAELPVAVARHSLDLCHAADHAGRRAWIVWILPTVNILALCTVFAITLAVVWRSFSSVPLRTSAAQSMPNGETTDVSAWRVRTDNENEAGNEAAGDGLGDETGEEGVVASMMVPPGAQEMETARQLSGSTRLDLLLEAQRLLGVVEQAVQEAGGELPEDFAELSERIQRRIEIVQADQDADALGETADDDPGSGDDGGGNQEADPGSGNDGGGNQEADPGSGNGEGDPG